MISFNLMPESWRLPGAYAEFSTENAIQGLVTKPYRVLMLGQRLSAGSVAAGNLTLVATGDQARTWFGQGSMLHRMVSAYRANDPITELWVLPLDDAAGGTAATGTLTFTGTATAAGTLSLYIAGQLIQVGVGSGDAAAIVSINTATAINANANLPVTASNTGVGVVTLTARHKGVDAGNFIDVRLGYYGEQAVAGISLAIVALSGGAGNPSLTVIGSGGSSLATLMGEVQYDVVVMPYTDGTNVGLLSTELADRFGPLRSIEGHAFTAMSGTLSSLQSYGGTVNDPHFTVMGFKKCPTPMYEASAALAATAAYNLNIDPARPLQTLAMVGILPPAQGDRFIKSERNVLLFNGIATFTVDSGGIVRVERTVTTYQKNQAGGADPSYLDVETLFTLGMLRYTWRARFLQKYPRCKLGDDGVRYGPGQSIITPNLAKAECFALFRLWEEVGWVENFDQFKNDIIVQRHATDPNRLDFLLPPNVINQARIFAAKIDFIL